MAQRSGGLPYLSLIGPQLRESCWVCVILFARVVVSERLCQARRGVRRGCRGAEPPAWGSGGTYHVFRWFFDTWFLPMVFLFPVKELGFWTNPVHWVRVLDAAGSYMYIIL
jgi:hypothetical protein